MKCSESVEEHGEVKMGAWGWGVQWWLHRGQLLTPAVKVCRWARSALGHMHRARGTRTCTQTHRWVRFSVPFPGFGLTVLQHGCGIGYFQMRWGYFQMTSQLQCLRGLHILYLNIKAVISVIGNFLVLIVFFWQISKNTSGLRSCSEIYYTKYAWRRVANWRWLSPPPLSLQVVVWSIFRLLILNPFCNILLPLAFAQWVLRSEHDCEFNVELLRELLPRECFVVVAFSLETNKRQQWEGTVRSHRSLSSVVGKVKLSYNQYKGLYFLTFQGCLLIWPISYGEFREEE